MFQGRTSAQPDTRAEHPFTKLADLARMRYRRTRYALLNEYLKTPRRINWMREAEVKNDSLAFMQILANEKYARSRTWSARECETYKSIIQPVFRYLEWVRVDGVWSETQQRPGSLSCSDLRLQPQLLTHTHTHTHHHEFITQFFPPWTNKGNDVLFTVFHRKKTHKFLFQIIALVYTGFSGSIFFLCGSHTMRQKTDETVK